jgi:uncharacterized protein
MIDYTPLDQPSILRFIFYPRKDFTPCPGNAFDLFVPVGNRASISCRFYPSRQEWPWILFFHGNGEVVSDYDEIASFYHQKKLNLVVADYRGYGASSGIPTMTDLVRDCHIILKEIVNELTRRHLRKDLWVMGRSLGSISALELAHKHQDVIKGLLIESGFPSVVRIISHLGIPAPGIDLGKIDQGCLEMIGEISLPSLMIHGEEDTLVPLENARDLYDHLGTKDKELLVIRSATHNDVLIVGFNDYFKAIQRWTKKGETVSGSA